MTPHDGSRDEPAQAGRGRRWAAGQFAVIAPLIVIAGAAVTAITVMKGGSSERSPSDLPVPQASHWVQPTSLNRSFPVPIGAEEWTFDYPPIAQALSTLQRDASGQLVWDADAVDGLDRVIAYFPENPSAREADRIALLITHGEPGLSGVALADAVAAFYRYHTAIKALPTPADLADSEANFQATLALQTHHFGKARATSLFAQRNALTAYLLARRRVMDDLSLSGDRRQLALKNLQHAFQTRRESVVGASLSKAPTDASASQ